MRFLADPALYAATDYCLKFLRALPAAPAPEKPERFHFYWYGEFGRKQAFALKSFLATQSLAHYELWLWLDGDAGYAGYTHSPHLRLLLPYLQVRRFDTKLEARGTPFAGHSALYEGLPLALRGNFARYIILYKYGGLYADLDVMFLRDLGPLLHNPQFAGEFCYPWAARPFANNAVLRVRQHSVAMAALMAQCIRVGSSVCRHSFVYTDLAHIDFLVLPCAFFDPLWLHRDRVERYPHAPFDGFAGFFRPFDLFFRRQPQIRSYRHFFPGAFAYHWHNCWNAPEAPNAYFGLFEAEIDALLRERLGQAR